MTDATTHDPATAPAWEIRVADVLDRLAEMPDDSVHCVVTSPPYWGLRDYGTASWDGGDPECGHTRLVQNRNDRPDGMFHGGSDENNDSREPAYRAVCGRCGARRVDQQLGLEASPDEYIAKMTAVFAEVRRVLRDDGTCWVNMGDSYASGQRGENTGNSVGMGTRGARESGQYAAQGNRNLPPGLGYKPKDLIGMPWRLAFALQADGWWLRSEIIWAKPNPMPESVTDRPTKAHEQIFLLTKRATYFYDAEAVREPNTEGSLARYKPGELIPEHRKLGGSDRATPSFIDGQVFQANGRNARSVWTIATAPFAEAHFATFPPEIPRRCIAAGTSERGVCPACGAPWRRVVEREAVTNGTGRKHIAGETQNWANGWEGVPRASLNVTTTGWDPTCTHEAPPIPATVLDPFSGAGTTVMVALRMGRSGIGIELNPEYADMSRKRILSDRGAAEPTNGTTPHGMAAVQGRMMGL